MAKHLAICEKKSAYPSESDAKTATVMHSMLDILGLVRKPEETKNEKPSHDSNAENVTENIEDPFKFSKTATNSCEINILSDEDTEEISGSSDKPDIDSENTVPSEEKKNKHVMKMYEKTSNTEDITSEGDEKIEEDKRFEVKEKIGDVIQLDDEDIAMTDSTICEPSLVERNTEESSDNIESSTEKVHNNFDLDENDEEKSNSCELDKAVSFCENEETTRNLSENDILCTEHETKKEADENIKDQKTGQIMEGDQEEKLRTVESEEMRTDSVEESTEGEISIQKNEEMKTQTVEENKKDETIEQNQELDTQETEEKKKTIEILEEVEDKMETNQTDNKRIECDGNAEPLAEKIEENAPKDNFNEPFNETDVSGIDESKSIDESDSRSPTEDEIDNSEPKNSSYFEDPKVIENDEDFTNKLSLRSSDEKKIENIDSQNHSSSEEANTASNDGDTVVENSKLLENICSKRNEECDDNLKNLEDDFHEQENEGEIDIQKKEENNPDFIGIDEPMDCQEESNVDKELAENDGQCNSDNVRVNSKDLLSSTNSNLTEDLTSMDVD